MQDIPPHVVCTGAASHTHTRTIIQFPAGGMTDRYLDKTEVVSVIYYSDNKQATPHYKHVKIPTPSLPILSVQAQFYNIFF